MRSITAISSVQHALDLGPAFGAASCLALDSDAGVVYVAGEGLEVACFGGQDGQEVWRVALPEAAQVAGVDLSPSSTVALFSHSPELEALCLGLSTGELLLLPTGPSALANGGGAPLVEEVGMLEGGVAAGQWSPDGEVLALLTGTGRLLLMNQDWELLAERSIFAGGAADEEHAGHALTHANSALTWRGDARYLATCTPGPGPLHSAAAAATEAHPSGSSGGGCRVRIWEREGCELHAVGEEAPALYPLLSWQPNGRHLYAAQALRATSSAQQAQQHGGEEAQRSAQQGEQPVVDEQAQQRRIGAWKRELRRKQAEAEAAAAAAGEASNRVILYERNGLQHGGFEVPGGGAVERMEWSRDSELLALVLREEDESGIPIRRLQLWHRSNWHWYLTSERTYSPCGGMAVAWDEAAPRMLHALTAEGNYEKLEFEWEALVSQRGTAAVVDGRRLLLTPLRHTLVPPPMCAAPVRCSGPVACAALCDFGDAEVLAVVMGDGRLEAAASCEEDLWEETLDEFLEAQHAQHEAAQAAAPSAGPAPAGAAGAYRTAGASPGVAEPHLPATPLLGLAPGRLARARQAAWAGEGRLVVVLGSDQLVELSVDPAAGTAAEACSAAAPAPLLRCISHPAGGCLLQLSSGEVWLYSPGGRLEQLPGAAFPAPCPRMAAAPLDTLVPDLPLPPAFGLTPRGQLYWGSRLVAADVTSFALRAEGAGGAFLLYTTRSHNLHTLALASLLPLPLGGAGLPAAAAAAAAALLGTSPAQQAQQAPQQARQQSFGEAMRAAMRPAAGQAGRDVRVRAVEQNALLVAAPPSGEEVILQMPRGNLEAIRPRALVLPAVAAAIDAGEYSHAWELAAVNRLDLNILVDYRWPAFLQRAGEFVAQVSDDQDVADLLSSLSPESTMAEGGPYFGALLEGAQAGTAATAVALSPSTGVGAVAGAAEAATAPGPGPAGGVEQMGGVPAAVADAANGAQPAGGSSSGGVGGTGGKVVAVSQAVRAALLARDPARYLRSVLTSYAKCEELEGGLALVKERKEAELEAGPSPGAPTAEDGLKHLLLFIPEDKVYRTALGMYDLPLAYMVVAHSQRDPGEYMLELQRIAALPEGPLRCHAVDLHLQRYDRALAHLVAAGEGHFAEALELARERGLLRQLLALYEGQPQLRRRVLEAYAEELERKNMDEDAGVAFLAAGREERALEAYAAAGQWRMALALAGKLRWGPEEVHRLASEVAAELAGTARPAEAAAVALEYLKDIPQALELLAQAREWREALRVAFSHQRHDLVETLVAPQAAAAAAEMLRDVTDNTARVEKYSARLRELRQRRSDMQAALAAADEESGLPSRQHDALDYDDAASEAPSAVSGLSVYTDRTHAGATTHAGSSLAPSTVGGRGGKRRHKKSKGTRIRQGSPEEEAQLAQHILSLAPSEALCDEAGQLAEALVLLGHETDARVLQQRLAALVAAQQAAAQDVLQHPPPALALALSWPAQQALEAAAQQGGPGAGRQGLAAAVAGVVGQLPGPELQLRVARAEDALKSSRWKWDILRAA